ncbi:glycoside hydrolase [Clavulina sp. PMI_390]|nr:glycoside hydrolase [Clavulina sp. PMI_390]
MEPLRARLSTDAFFRDASGRAVLLRGVNLVAGKAPPSTPSHVPPFDDAENGRVSFVNTPLRLDDGSADVHLARLRGYGFTVLRYVVCWEAIEHAGPRQYDQDFIQYTLQVLRRCAAFGFRVFIDPHQDLFSRFSGGCGAPIWALHACGLEPRNFAATHAALLHCDWHPQSEEKTPLEFPSMLWTTNHDWLQQHYIDAFSQLATAICDAGLNDTCVIGYDSMNEPDPGYIGIVDLSKIGKENSARMGPTPTMFEGMRFGMGHAVEVDNYRLGKTGPHKKGRFKIDPGGKCAWLSEEKGQWEWNRDPGWVLGTCLWAQHGVWDTKTGKLLIPDYFQYPRHSMVQRAQSAVSTSNGTPAPDTPDSLKTGVGHSGHQRKGSIFSRFWPSLPRVLHQENSQQPPRSYREEKSGTVNFIDRYWAEHFATWAKAIRDIQPDAIIFVQPSVFTPPPSHPLLPGVRKPGADINHSSHPAIRGAYSPHFYDGLTIMHRKWYRNWNADVVGILRGKYSNPAFGLRVGKSAVRNLISKQLGELKKDTHEYIGARTMPTLIGETGVPMNLDNGASYDSTSPKYRDFSTQAEAMDAILVGCDDHLLNYTLWGFNPHNSHEWGDNWNREDLSIWSPYDVYHGPLHWNENELTALIQPQADTASIPTEERLSLLDDFLTQGARAAKAFCRPYPIFTAGTPIRLEFSIETSVMELDIQLPPPSKDATEASSPLTTEIYVPYIHYHAKTLERPEKVDQSPGPPHGAVSEILRDQLAESARLHFIDTGVRNTLAVDVEVSEGSYQIQGQMLRWTYSNLATTGSEQDRVISLRLRRSSGTAAWK